MSRAGQSWRPDGPGMLDLRALGVVLTADCNLRCSYCYQNARTRQRMNWPTLRAAVDLLLTSREREKRLLFTGGEPLLAFPLIQRAVDHAEQMKRRGCSVHYDITTNGLLLGPRKAAFFERYAFEVQLSFDGIPAAQNLRGKETFQPLDRLLDWLRADHPALFSDCLTIVMTVTARNISYLADSVRYFLSKGVRAISVAPAITDQPIQRHLILETLDREVARLSRLCLSHYRLTNEVPVTLFRKWEPQRRSRGAASGRCGIWRGDTFAVDVDGEVSGCVLLARSYQSFRGKPLARAFETLRFGSIGEAGLGERLANCKQRVQDFRLFEGQEGKYSSYGRCRECPYFGTCFVCPGAVALQRGVSDPDRIPDFLCAFNRSYLKYRRQFPVQSGFQTPVSTRTFRPQLSHR